MNIDKNAKIQLISRFAEQHRKIQSLDKRHQKDSNIKEDTTSQKRHRAKSFPRANTIGFISVNRKGIITSCNKALLEFSGYCREDLIGNHFTKMVYINAKNMHRYVSIFKDILACRGSRPFQIIHNHPDGTGRYGKVYFRPLIDSNHSLKGFKIIIKDINLQMELEKKDAESDEKTEIFMEASLDGVVIHEEGNIYRANEVFLELFNLGKEDIAGRNILELFSDNDMDSFAERLKKKGTQPIEINVVKSTGSHGYMETSGKYISYNGRRMRIDIFHDISELRKAEKKIKYFKFHDSLTGLYNRKYIEKVLGNVCREKDLLLHFIICDLNGLKLVNDAFGCREGDKLLKRVSKILKYCARKEDTVARWGGDEFFILLSRSTVVEVEDVARKIRNICSNTKDQKIPLNISIGIATRKDNNQDLREIIKEAEDNMNTNKLLERKSIYSSIMATFERMLWEKSHETKEHAERLKGFIIKLGRSISLPPNKLDELVLLSTLHDIGKVAVPDSILLKKGKLSKEEWNVIRRHPEIGYNIVKSTPQIAVVADDILAHHEWWDGSGYPQGLKGDDIPIRSCITSIVDAYDVMISGRPYKNPLSDQDAKSELIRCAGVQFNPLLVDRFINYC